MRQLVLLTLVVGALVAIAVGAPGIVAGRGTADARYVTTAHQLGVVGYRDPAGAISPDGKRFAYSEGRFIRIVPIGGGAPVTLPAGDGQVRFLEWTSNDTVIAVPRPAASARTANGERPAWLIAVSSFPAEAKNRRSIPTRRLWTDCLHCESRVLRLAGDNGMVALWSADLVTKRARSRVDFCARCVRAFDRSRWHRRLQGPVISHAPRRCRE